MDFAVLTTRAVIDEITNSQQNEIVVRHIELGNISIDQFGNDVFILSLFAKYRGLSLTDCSVIDLANRTGGILLSSDKSVRNISKENSIEVRGVIWIIEQLINSGIISANNGCEKLSQYANINPRAPKKEIFKMIEYLELN